MTQPAIKREESKGNHMQKLLFVLLSTSALSAYAVTPSFYIPGLKSNRDYKQIECPSVANEFKPLIANLNRLKTDIKKNANCQPVFEQVSRYGDQVQQGRDKYLKLTKDNKGKVLTAQDTKFIKDYAQNATQYAFTLLDMVTGRSTCFESDKKNEGLLFASTLIHEVTSLASAVAGPYGAPISVVGNLISGFFTGMHSISQNRAGYKFEDPESRQQYVENLCTYYSMQEELNKLLDPRSHRENLETIAVAVTEHLTEVVEECTDCTKLLGFLDQEEYVANFGSEKNQTNLVNMIYRLESEVNETSDNFIGSYIIDTYNNKRWLETEISQFDRNSNEIVSNIGQDLLMDQKLDIEKFILERETPRFLKFQLEKARDAYKDLMYYYRGQLVQMIYMYDYRLKLKEDPSYNPPYGLAFTHVDNVQGGLKALEELISNERLSYEDKTMLKTHYTKFIDLYDSSYISYGVFNSFCNFFKEAEIFNFGINRSCSTRKSTDLEEDLRDATPAARPYNFQNNNGDKSRGQFENWGESIADTIELLSSQR
jgi:hypothetical protein